MFIIFVLVLSRVLLCMLIVRVRMRKLRQVRRGHPFLDSEPLLSLLYWPTKTTLPTRTLTHNTNPKSKSVTSARMVRLVRLLGISAGLAAVLEINPP